MEVTNAEVKGWFAVLYGRHGRCVGVVKKASNLVVTSSGERQEAVRGFYSEPPLKSAVGIEVAAYRGAAVTTAELVHPAAADAVEFAEYRASIPGIAIACPGEALRDDEVARWARRRGVTVTAHTSDQLALAVSSGIDPARIVMHGDRGAWGPIRCAVRVGVRQFVVDAAEQVPILEHCTRRRQQVLVDVSTVRGDEIIEAAADSDRLALVGLHYRMDANATGMFRYAIAVDAMVARMAGLYARRGPVSCRISLAGPLDVSLPVAGRILDEATESSCVRHHVPRPSVVFTPALR
jgi:hypothetical protein